MANGHGDGYALVTGGAKGLGAAISRYLAKEGYRVLVHCYKSMGTAEALRDEIHKDGGYCEVYQADLCSTSDRERMIKDALLDLNPPLMLLVNNAGYYPMCDMDTMGLYDWKKAIELNLTAPFDLIQLTRRYMAQRNFMNPCAIPSRIINIGDVAADQPRSRDIGMPYYIAKAGLLQLTRSYARKFAKDGITVNMVSPGYLENSVSDRGDFRMPMGRKGTYDDIVGAIAYLLSEDAWYVSGANIQVSGAWRV